MIGFFQNIEEITLKNDDFRQVLFTGKYAQLVVMSIPPKENIGREVHETVDQFFRVEAGEGQVIVNGEEHLVKDGDAFIIPAGAQHNVFNTSSEQPLKLYTIYSPPNHPEGTVHHTKKEAEAGDA